MRYFWKCECFYFTGIVNTINCRVDYAVHYNYEGYHHLGYNYKSYHLGYNYKSYHHVEDVRYNYDICYRCSTDVSSPIAPAERSMLLTETSKWGQCGGIGYTGPTACVAGSTCVVSNSYYSQCL
jgi:hypothetical protein